MPQERKYASGRERQAAYRARQRGALQELPGTKGTPALPAVPTIPGYRRWQAGLSAALVMLGNVHREMQVYYEDRSERWQDSERGEAFLEWTESLEEIIDSLETIDMITQKTKENKHAY